MVLQVGPGGEVFDGPAPAGDYTVVLALVGGQLHEVLLPRPVAGDSSEASREALRYDSLIEVPAPQDATPTTLAVGEGVPSILEEVVSALLARAEESAPTPVEAVRATVGGLADELLPNLQEQAELLILLSPEELAEVALAHALELTVAELAPPIAETVHVTTHVGADDFVPLPVDQTAVTIAGVNEPCPRPADGIVLNLTLTPYAASVLTSTNWSNPSNALGNTSDTAATLTAASSGLAGTTSNTVSGTLTLGYGLATQPEFTIAAVTLRVDFSQTNSGGGLGNSSTRSIEFSVDGGQTWKVMQSGGSAAARNTLTLDITADVAGLWSRLADFRVRYVGSVTSGVGIGATTTASVCRAWLTITTTPREY